MGRFSPETASGLRQPTDARAAAPPGRTRRAALRHSLNRKRLRLIGDFQPALPGLRSRSDPARQSAPRGSQADLPPDLQPGVCAPEQLGWEDPALCRRGRSGRPWHPRVLFRNRRSRIGLVGASGRTAACAPGAVAAVLLHDRRAAPSRASTMVAKETRIRRVGPLSLRRRAFTANTVRIRRTCPLCRTNTEELQHLG